MVFDKILIERVFLGGEDDKQSTGNIHLLNKDGFIIKSFFTIELPWLDNKSNISCIPDTKTLQEKYGVDSYIGRFRPKEESGSLDYDHIHITNVPERSYCLIHIANYYTQIQGCVAVGLDITDINSDGWVDTVESKKAFNQIMELCPRDKDFEIEIYNY